ncbi:MAG TPA: CheR family methyltransferase [Anaerolineales bacterium]|jgi:two-component system CheB/CheR fusion protein|nr:CheR family methyltransferase [Anaerolineales bacterium]
MGAGQDNKGSEELLEFLKRKRGLDFTGYKRSSLSRRIRKRMLEANIENYAEYMDKLEVDPDEFVHLFNTILINVTRFYRDPEAWWFLREEIIPDIIRLKSGDAPIRIWCAGSASGEEAYSVAMLLAEALGMGQFKNRVKIYATDIDEDALFAARQATFERRHVEGIPPDLLEKYFEQIGSRYTFRQEPRREVIFGRHNLIQDAPISRIDLLICRNVLMYLNAETQSQVLTRFHFALNPNGYLFLGKAEMLIRHSNLFSPESLEYRVFTKMPQANLRDRLLLMNQVHHEVDAGQYLNVVRVRDSSFELSPLAQIVLDKQRHVVLINERAGNLFHLSARDLGRPFQDLEISYRPVELRATLDQAEQNKEPITIDDVEIRAEADKMRFITVHIVPLVDPSAGVLGISINFQDVSDHKHLQQRLQRANQELETAMEEVQSTNEELETTNEELQSTIEELETTNEELQSSNEELETMNEELQSTNQELETVNAELRTLNREFDEVNAFLEAIMYSLPGAVIVLDQELCIVHWDKKSEDFWGLRAEEVSGQHFLNLDIGLPVEKLRKPINNCLRAQSPCADVTVESRNRRGQDFRCAVSITPLERDDRFIQGVILVMQEAGAQ